MISAIVFWNEEASILIRVPPLWWKDVLPDHDKVSPYDEIIGFRTSEFNNLWATVNGFIITVTSWWARWLSNQRCLDCLFNRRLRRRSKKTSKLRVTGLCDGISLVTAGFPWQRANNAENVSIWWHHHDSVHHGISLIQWFAFILHLSNIIICVWCWFTTTRTK